MSYFASHSCIHFSSVAKYLQPPWRILFFGTDKFSVETLQVLRLKLRTDTYVQELCVSTCISRNLEMKNAVYNFTCEEKLELFQWPFEVDDICNRFDIGIVASFGHLIPNDIIDAFLCILNVHDSLLPRWRGATACIHAITNGDVETGVTVMKMHPYKFDVGDIVRQCSISILPHETTLDLTDAGANLLIECVRDLPHSVQNAVAQPKEGVTYAPKVASKFGVINWMKMSAQQIYNLHRAVKHIFPVSAMWFDEKVKLFDVELDTDETLPMNQNSEGNTHIIGGLIHYCSLRSLLRVQCRDGKYITVGNIRVGGKKLITPKQFLKGYLDKVSNELNKRFT